MTCSALHTEALPAVAAGIPQRKPMPRGQLLIAKILFP
jgi:hypothetical protein